ncbi:alpha/beta fold hydrolase [Scrofimicrobium sp. R131]|uniref:Alpha/beta fold hydrolase n=1 Tax=Scrofimicrobium appendicitidis TaxID=3079930 RepID=A0AAU7V6B0_9ACTO
MTAFELQQDGPAGAPTLVLAHSLGSDVRIWDEVVADLADSWHIVRWNLPGHGASEIPSGPARMETVVEVLLSQLDEAGIGRFHVAGISLGAIASLAVAEMAPERVLSLAMLDSGAALLPSEPWFDRAELVRAEGMSSLVDATMDRWFTPEFRAGKGESRYRRTRETFLACPVEGYAYCCELIGNTDLRADLSQIQVPTLILTGDEDAGMSPGKAEELAHQIPGAAGSFQVIKNSRHLTCVEHPRQVAAALTQVMCQVI